MEEVAESRALPARPHRQWTPLAHALTATGDHWTLLIVLALADGKVRLSGLRERLPGVSSGVLDHHVRQMAAVGLLSRRRFREMPPRVEIELTERGRELLPIATALARWGMRHQWSQPADGERVQAEALLRQLPALLGEQTDLPSGAVELVLAVDGAAGQARARYRFEISDGRLRMSEPSGEGEERVDGEERVEGDEASWIAALGPGRDQARLRFKGRRRLARRVLNSLPRAL